MTQFSYKLVEEVAKELYIRALKILPPDVKEALKKSPTRQDIVVHLNPNDLATCQKSQVSGAISELEGIKFVADPKVGRAECVLETHKGTIKSLIDEHLEHICKTLEKAG